jgi:hypothetical protein
MKLAITWNHPWGGCHKFNGGSAAVKQKRTLEKGWEVEEDQVTDIQFDHSWKPSGPDLGPGWFWIPKGNLVMDRHYLARRDEVGRFGYLARRVKRLPSPARSLACSPTPWRWGW